MTEFETLHLVLPRHVSRQEARALLAEYAEYGRWELLRVVVYAGGARRLWLRRRVSRAARPDRPMATGPAAP